MSHKSSTAGFGRCCFSHFSRRVKDIWEGNEGYENALAELLEALLPAGEPGIFDWVMDLYAVWQPSGKVSDKNYDAMRQGVSDWIYRYFSSLLFSGNGSAGQDGRTVQMVCRPGLTVLVLYRLEFDGSSMKPLTVGAAVYCFGGWQDVGSLMNLGLSGEGMSEDVLTRWFDEMAAKMDEANQDETSMVKALLNRLIEVYSRLTDPAWLREMLFFDIRGGEINEIPAKGLENVAVLDGELLELFIMK